MANYGITFEVTGKSVQEMAKIEEALKKLGVTAQRETTKVEDAVKHADDTFAKLQRRIVEVFAIEKVREFAKEVLHVTAEFEGFDNRIKYASENTTDAINNMQFLRREVDALHLPMRQVYEGFSEMEAGLKGTGIEGQRLRNLFEGISTASATLHLPEYQLQRTLYDLKEIGEIGLNMRIERSLGTALPGIGKIVKDTFGKSMHDLQLEGMSGAAFLDKLGPALKKQFESGLAAYGESLQAKMADTGNRFLQMQIDMGEKLKPVYIALMDTLIALMDKVGGFVGFLNNHSGALEKLWHMVEIGAIAWGVYKAGLIAVTVAERVHTAALSAMTVASYSAEFGTAGLSFALGELGISLSTIGWGAIAVAVGAIVYAFMQWNDEMDKTVEKISGLKNIGRDFDQTNDTYQKLIGRFEAYQKDPTSFTSGEVESLAVGLKNLQDQQHANLVGDISPHAAKIQQAVDSIDMAKPLQVATPLGYADVAKEDNPLYQRMTAAADSLNHIEVISRDQQDKITKALATPALSKALKNSSKISYDPINEAANKSSHLSGVEGGLGQAKVINIRIDTVQKNVVTNSKDLVRHAEEAVDFIVRAANNFAESQQGTY
jgi:hypothetical protein